MCVGMCAKPLLMRTQGGKGQHYLQRAVELDILQGDVKGRRRRLHHKVQNGLRVPIDVYIM